MESYTRREALKLFAGVAMVVPRVVDRLGQSEVLKPKEHYGFVSYDMALRQDFKNRSVPSYRAGTLLRYQNIIGENSIVKVKHDAKGYHRPRMPLAHGDIYFPKNFLSPVLEKDLTPISPQIEVGDKKIVIDLQSQTLAAYERGEPVLVTKISSGLNGNTPRGHFPIYARQIARYMQPKAEYINQSWDHPGVPWVLYFEPEKGLALHGAFWHNEFGSPASSGCVNLRERDARFLWRWTSPSPSDLQVQGRPTLPEERVFVNII